MNVKCFLVRTWKQSAHGPCISWRFPRMFRTRTTLLAPHSSKQGTCGGPFGAHHPSANYILFHMEGRHHFRVHIHHMTPLGKLGFSLYHHRILQRSFRKSLRGAGRLSSDTRRKRAADQLLGIRQYGEGRNGSWNEYSHAAKHALSGQQGEMSSLPLR